MPLKTGPKHLEENFHELRHGPQFAETKKEHGAATARSQMIAIALKEARKRSKGGKVHVGPIRGPHPGRTDTEKMKVGDGSYVLPSETISHLGENNSENGLKKADHFFGENGVFAGDQKREAGGSVKTTGKPVDCITANGEYVIPAATVRAIGKGDIDFGHKILDHWVMSMRTDHIKTLISLAPPAKD